MKPRRESGAALVNPIASDVIASDIIASDVKGSTPILVFPVLLRGFIQQGRLVKRKSPACGHTAPLFASTYVSHKRVLMLHRYVHVHDSERLKSRAERKLNKVHLAW